MVYLDSWAIVKLVVREAQSTALREFLGARTARASCGLARTEVLRAVAARGAEARRRALRVLAGLNLVQLDAALLDAAGALPGQLRGLDAIHVAAARELGGDLDCLVTYDHRMAAATAGFDLEVVAPA